jgi:integrase
VPNNSPSEDANPIMSKKQRRPFSVALINGLRFVPKAPKPGEALKPVKAWDRTEVHDARIPGFVVRVAPNGAKTFSFVYRPRGGGKHRRVTLGAWPVDPAARADALEKLRRRALALQAQVAAGRDPVQEEKDAQAKERERRPRARTVAWMAEEYVRREAKPNVATWRAAEAALAKHWLPVIGDVPIAEVTRQQLYDVLDALVAERRLGAAGQARKFITRLFNWGLERGYLDRTPLPLRHKGLSGRNRPGRARALGDDELTAVWLGAAQLGTPWRQAVRVLLLTGCRRNEVLEARRSELTRDRWLEIPAERYKTARDHSVPLSDAAWAEIESLPRFLHPDPYLFSVRGGAAPVRGLVRAKQRLDEEAAKVLGRELRPYRLHDLRVTCRSKLAQLRVPHDVAEAVIGHAKQGVTAIYNKHEYRDERREALDRYAQHVLQLVSEAKRAAGA